LSMGAPFMVDARRRTRRVRSSVRRVDGAWRLSYRLDDRWLDRRGRAWPVAVDPVIAPNPDGDCMLDASQPEASFCAANPMKLGMVGGHDHRIVMRFGLGGIPRGAEVAGATLVFQQSGDQQGAWTQTRVEPLTEPFTAAASWNRSDGTDRWSDPGGEGDGEAAGEFPSYIGGISGENYSTMLRMVREWVSGKRPNHGMVLSVPGGQNGTYIDSSEAASTKPYLSVVYKERIGERRGWVHDSQRLTDRIELGVNVASGNLKVDQTDFQMPGGLGPAVEVSRTYNSLEEMPLSLGEWKLSTGPDLKLEQQAGGSFMRLVWPDGAKAVYDRQSGGSYTTPPGYDNTLQKDQPSAGKWQLTDHGSQTKYRFENHTKGGRLYEVEDRNGRKLSFVYDANGLLARIEDANNDASTTNDDVRFSFASATQLSSMTDPGGRIYGYGYTGGYLTSFTDPHNSSSHKTLYEYQGTNSQLSKITTPQGNVTLIDYFPAGHAHAGRVKTVTRVTNTSTMTGPTTSFAYTIRRDGSGETEVTDPIGTATADENDRITRHVFDEQGRVTKTIDALGRQTSQTYTKNSNVESYTAASNGGTTPNTTAKYDDDDNPTESSTPVGSGAIKDCADFGAPDSSPCDGAPSGYGGVSSAVAGSKYLPGRQTNPQGGRTNFAWQPGSGTDNNGNLHGVEQTTNGGQQQSSVAMVYEPAGSSVDGKAGQLKEIRDGRNQPTTYGYDAKGNLTRVTPPDPGAPNPVGTTWMSYNANLARLATVLDGNGRYRLLSYDNLDRLTKIEFTGTNTTLDSGEPYVAYAYDRDGNQTQETSREQTTNTVRTRSMVYDTLNRVTSESLPGGATNSYTYDQVGNLRSLTDGGGTVEYAYDATNQVRAVYEPGTAKPTKFTHDKDGKRTTTKYPNGVTIDQSYDGAFRLTEIWSKDAGATTLQKLTYAYTDPQTQRQTPIVYEKTDGVLGQTTRYSYDALDRLTAATIKSSSGDWASNGTLAKYDYALDAAGNVTSRAVTGSQAPNATTGYTYNSFNELCQRRAGSPAASCPTSSPPYTYDKNGNQLTAPGRTASYNLLDQTTNLTIAGSPTSMVYLGTGQDRKITEGASSLQHNVLGLGSRGSDRFTRDDGGTLVSRRNGTARHYYLFDALGSITGLTNSSGAVSERYDFEPYGTPAPRSTGQWGAATGAADVAQGQFGFAAGYRSVGGLYHYGQRYYDPADMRWTQPDPLDQTGDLRQGNRYVYAGADPVNLVDPRGTRYCTAQACFPQNSRSCSREAANSSVCRRKSRQRGNVGVREFCVVAGGSSGAKDIYDNVKGIARRPSLATGVIGVGCAVAEAGW
jgi:RHS repeat-associated protein